MSTAYLVAFLQFPKGTYRQSVLDNDPEAVPLGEPHVGHVGIYSERTPTCSFEAIPIVLDDWQDVDYDAAYTALREHVDNNAYLAWTRKYFED